jgi:membrane dipeptidase
VATVATGASAARGLAIGSRAVTVIALLYRRVADGASPEERRMQSNRRDFLALAAAAGTLAAPARWAAAHAGGDPLQDLIVINSCGELDDPNDPPIANPGDAPPEFKARVARDARSAGATAIAVTMGYVFGEAEPFEQSVRAIADWDALIRAHPGDYLKVYTTEDIRRAKAQRRVGVIYAFQNAAMMGANAGRADLFANLGMRVIQLTYNQANQLGGGSLAGDIGLTPFGHEVVERLNVRRVIVDLAHSGRQICLDAVRASTRPVAISHTGCRALIDLPRNKTDEELRLVAERGGYVGIYFMPFLAVGRNATEADVIAHLEHAVDVCGEDHVGIGTDGSFTDVDSLQAYQAGLARQVAERRAKGVSAPGEAADIYPFAIDLRGPEQLRRLARTLAKRGHSSARIAKVLGQNFLRFAREVWGA